MALDLVLLGPPGSGKGTQAVRLTEHYRIPAIATGDILRAQVEAGTPQGQRVRSYLDRGELVPDQLVVDIIRHRLSEPDTEAGFLDAEGDLRLAPDIGSKLRTARNVREVLRQIRQAENEREE